MNYIKAKLNNKDNNIIIKRILEENGDDVNKATDSLKDLNSFTKNYITAWNQGKLIASNDIIRNNLYNKYEDIHRIDTDITYYTSKHYQRSCFLVDDVEKFHETY